MGVGKYPAKTGGGGIGKSDADARLYDGEAAGADACGRVDLDAVQRVGTGFYHAQRGSGRELRVGVQGDHVADRRREFSLDQDVVVTLAAQECIQFLQL